MRLVVEADDFAEVPPPKYFRLSPGREVRLRGAYFVTATDVVKDADGTIAQVNATYDPASRGGNSPDGRKVKSTMHWVSAAHATPITVALYDRLFSTAAPGAVTGEPLDDVNPHSRELLTGCRAEAALGVDTGVARVEAALAEARELNLVYEVMQCLATLVDIADDGGPAVQQTVRDELESVRRSLGVVS